MISAWSCGGGTQSAAIAALIVSGRIEPPDYAVIADTGYEKSTTWAYVDGTLTPELSRVGVALVRVKAEDYATVGVWGGKDKQTALIPGFTTAGHAVGKLPNFCSYEWKRRVVERYMRAQGVTDYESWIGFSADEASRTAKVIAAKRPQRYPLIERGMTRADSIALVERMGWPSPPRSSCWMCPNQSDQEWRETKQSQDWPLVVAFDAALRLRDPALWLHRSAEPIAEADFNEGQGDLFGCESGECFV